jgi:putative ABC transport system permease protein
MIRHFLKLAWRRKRGNALLIAEVFASFLVVFAVATATIQLARSYRAPLGFDYKNVWSIAVDRQKATDSVTWTPDDTAAFGRLLREGAHIEGVESIAGALNAPYDFSTSIGGMTFGGRTINAEFTEATDDFRDVLRLKVARGRWFETGDDVLTYRPIVVNAAFAREAFPGEDPIGKSLPRAPTEAESRIVGVVSDYRKGGELSLPGPFIIHRIVVGRSDERPPQALIVRARPGVDAGFEERLVRGLQEIVPDWSLEARSLESSRQTSFRVRLVPLIVAGLVASFLLAMVALGLIGVLWQNVTRRAREFGLRRAAGASQHDIQRQVLMEITLTAALGLVVGLVLVAQIPLIAFLSFLSKGVIAVGAAAAVAIVVGIALAAGAYPSWLATRIQPADALRDE